MKKMLVTAMFVSVAACGGDSSDAVSGKWHAMNDTLTVTLDINEIDRVGDITNLSGTVSLRPTSCIRTGALSGTLTGTSVNLLGGGSGEKTDATSFTFAGEIVSSTLVGDVELESEEPSCMLKQRLTFTR
jgi:outer membrane lipoprotein SlyB